MRYGLALVFLLISLWQFMMTRRAFIQLRQKGDQTTSPFIMLSLWSSLVFTIIFFGIGLSILFANYSFS
ncbi:hypothetical protein [Enterococcus sp. CSURQ0835]|uniref:hypothetical protein n=1 Tax=Enterococcus sp. CSURQ0835 TaxID=2681394 RepID=UPI0013591CCC|nr:hypothetical protein [Enterococcus sp. CSURQ0835]